MRLRLVVAFAHGGERRHRRGKTVLLRVFRMQPRTRRKGTRPRTAPRQQGGRKEAFISHGQGRNLARGRMPSAQVLRMGRCQNGMGCTVFRQSRRLLLRHNPYERPCIRFQRGLRSPPRTDVRRIRRHHLEPQHRAPDRVERRMGRKRSAQSHEGLSDVLACGRHQDLLLRNHHLQRADLHRQARDLQRIRRQELGKRLHHPLGMAVLLGSHQQKDWKETRELGPRDRRRHPQNRPHHP